MNIINNSENYTYLIEFYNNLYESSNNKINYNLGWNLGFRDIDKDKHLLEYSIPPKHVITSNVICFIPYTKYFIIVIDDMNKGQTNKGLVQISNSKQFISQDETFKNTNVNINCDSCNDMVENSKNMTKNQIYSAVQINNYRNNFNNTDSKLNSQLINNVFAVIPFENKSMVWGITTFTSDKNKFRRKYSGPINIDKLHIKLLDDVGNIINLNGTDWSFTMMSTHVYER